MFTLAKLGHERLGYIGKKSSNSLQIKRDFGKLNLGDFGSYEQFLIGKQVKLHFQLEFINPNKYSNTYMLICGVLLSLLYLVLDIICWSLMTFQRKLGFLIKNWSWDFIIIFLNFQRLENSIWKSNW